MKSCAVIGGFVSLSFALVSAAPTNVTEAVPLQAIPAILDLFKTHQVVGLGEGPHGNVEGHAFRLKLIRDPRLPAVVNDILVESGTARYQEVMDRFMTLIPASLCRDADYMKMRLARLATTSGSQGSSDPAGALKKLCADLSR